MTVPSQTNKDQQAGNGVSTVFTVPFRILAAAHLEVLQTIGGVTTTLILTADYAVTGVGNPNTTVTFVVAPASGTTITFVRNVPLTQETDYVPNDPFPAQSHENALDKLTMIAQQQEERIASALTLPPQVVGVSTTLPDPAPLNLIGWTAGADALRNFTAADIGTTLAFSNFIADQFTATPGQTDFTLSADPGAIGNLDVSIDGVTQLPADDYTYLGTTLTFVAPMAGGEKVLARYGTALPTGITSASAVQFQQAGAGAALRNSQEKQRERLTPYDFGATGDGVSDDRAALVAADAAAAAQGKPLIFPYGTFKVSAPIGGLLASWIGEKGASIAAANTVTLNGGAFLQWLPAIGLRISGLTVDFQSRPVTVGSEAVIACVNPTDIVIENCRILNLTGCGVTLNGPRNFVVKDNYISRAAMSNSYNQAILVSSSSRSSFNGKVTGNTCDQSGMDFSCTDTTISDNDVFGWGFGAGVTTEQDVANSARYTISNNRLRLGVGIDTNLTRPMGIENWGPQSVIKGNICYSNSGNGIVNGGQNTTVDSNICFNNALSSPDPGIVSRYADATFNANGSIYSNNKCFDTQGSPTQTYGYYDNSASLTRITLIGNEFNGNHATAPELVQGTVCKYTGPSLEFTSAWAPPTVSNNATATNVVNCAGASLGDFVEVSYSGSLNGLSLSGYVSVINTVTVVLTNNSGAGYQPPVGTFRIRVTKPKNYAAY